MTAQRLRILLALLLLSTSFALAQNQTEPKTGVEGVITIAPIHPGPTREDVPNSAPLAHTAFAVQNEKGTVTTFTTDAAGRFSVLLDPGHYTVWIEQKKSAIGRGSFEVDVVAGKMTKVEWRCDTRMR